MRQLTIDSKLVTSPIAFVIVLALANSGRAESPRFSIVENETIVFMGGTNMVRLQRAGYVEAMLTREFAEQKPRFRDLAWEADTVFRLGTVAERWRPDGFGDLEGQLKRVGATTIIAQFGMLESLAGLSGIENFKKAYGELVDRFLSVKSVRQVVLISPTPFEPPPDPLIPDLSKRNDDLERYVAAIKEIAAERNLRYVNLMTAKPVLTDNGMHVKPGAQIHVANEIVTELQLITPLESEFESLRQAILEKHRLWYDYWRPANWKLLYGDDAERQFTRGGENYIRFKDEWKLLLPLIERAEKRVWDIASGEPDPGLARPAPETLHADAAANIEKELASFSVPDGMKVNLFASEADGLTSPLAIRWDTEGRLYCTVTTTYPHVYPGHVPNDKIIVLEDLDHDGVADKSTVFADGLNIPTGIELGDGGVYVGQNTELLLLKDLDGDGVADSRRVVLGGFGNGDSHQTINSFVWSPGGELYFGQGDGCESRVETPWGSSDLFQAGFYRFRPKRLQLHPLLDDFMGPGNPWGVAFDEWGQIFSIDGAGGVAFLSPGQVPVSHRLKLRDIGEPGGYCGISFLDGPQFPESMHGQFMVGDYKRNRIKRFSVRPNGAAYDLKWEDPILQSSHRNFRPVDVKIGPDGALYVVDWYNPITCHQDDEYRHPDRDKAHGRIWRVSSASVGSPGMQPVGRDRYGIESLASPHHFDRYQAKRTLTARDPQKVATELDTWVQALDPQSARYEHHLYEALGAYATIEVVEPNLLNRVLDSPVPQARAYASRIVGRWHDRLDDPLSLLKERAIDEHRLVRLEAVMACAAVPSARSMEVAAIAADRSMDWSLKYAFEQTVHQLKPYWLPALRNGALTFAKTSQLAAVLNVTGGQDALQSLKTLVASEELPVEAKVSAIGSIFVVGDADDIQKYGFDVQTFHVDSSYDATFHARALERMVDVARFREIQPSEQIAAKLPALIDQPFTSLRTQAVTLAGVWKVNATDASVRDIAQDRSLPVELRAAAFQAIVNMQLGDAKDVLAGHAIPPHSNGIRAAAIRSLVEVDVALAAELAARFLGEVEFAREWSEVENAQRNHAVTLLIKFLDRERGGDALAMALPENAITPSTARMLLRSLFATGRSNNALYGVLSKLAGATAIVPDYRESYVRELAVDSRKSGDVVRGEALFKSLACSTCHQVDDASAGIGPELTAIGTTLSSSRIIEEILWPNRQVKEGYSVLQVTTVDGLVLQGFERRTKESQASRDIVLQDLSTRELITIEKDSIDDQHDAGSPMPAGLTAALDRKQLLDLLRYVTELGKIK